MLMRNPHYQNQQMNQACKIALVLVLIYTCIFADKLYAQEFSNGIFAGHFKRFKISTYTYSDTIYLKKWTSKKDTFFCVIPTKKTNKFIMDNIEYSIIISTKEIPNSLWLCSKKDSIELIKVTSFNSNKRIDWEMVLSSSYADNGQPARFTVNYYDTNQVYRYPFYPDSSTSFVNNREENVFFVKHGTEYVFYSKEGEGYDWIREKRKWNRGKLVKRKEYKFAEKKLKYFSWSKNY